MYGTRYSRLNETVCKKPDASTTRSSIATASMFPALQNPKIDIFTWRKNAINLNIPNSKEIRPYSGFDGINCWNPNRITAPFKIGGRRKFNQTQNPLLDSVTVKPINL